MGQFCLNILPRMGAQTHGTTSPLTATIHRRVNGCTPHVYCRERTISTTGFKSTIEKQYQLQLYNSTIWPYAIPYSMVPSVTLITWLLYTAFVSLWFNES